MPECTSCGAAVSNDERVCPSCGEQVSGSTEQFEAVGLTHAEAEEVSESEAEGPALYVRKGPETGDTFFLERPSLTIGRDPASDIFLNDVTVSRQHATIERSGTGVDVRDAGSLNGTYVNGKCVDSARLAPGDVLQIGTFQMVFFDTTEQP